MKKNSFSRRTAIRIGLVSFLLAIIASPITWYVAKENAEEETVSLAIEESRRLLNEFDAIQLHRGDAVQQAQRAANAISGGLFDIAEIYSPQGHKLGESLTESGEAIENLLPKHGSPNYQKASYESLRLPDDRWVLRVFIPIRADEPHSAITGYFEGVRVIPVWQCKPPLISASDF
jgi:hypothetical protein